MTHEGRRAGAFLVALLAVGFCVAVFIRPLLRFAAGPESDILELIKTAERDGLKLKLPTLPAPELVSSRAHYDRISVSFTSESEATAFATLDFDGSLGGTEVSSLGAERVPFKAQQGSFVPSRGLAPQLVAVVEKLEARRQALNAADVAGVFELSDRGVPLETLEARRDFAELVALKDRNYRVKSWHIRLERESAVVTETFVLTGSRSDRPIAERGSQSFSLQLRDGNFVFVSAGSER